MIDIQSKLIELEDKIKDAYMRSSVIDEVCTPIPVEQTIRYGQFSQFIQKLLVEREHMQNPSHFLILDEVGTSVARGETKQIIEKISSLPSKTVEKLSYEDILVGIQSLRDLGFVPNHIFLPINYFHEVFEWNKGKWRPDTARGSAFSTLYTNSGEQLSINYSNKYIPFEHVMITSKEANIWEYRHVDDDSTKNRLKVKFDWNYNDPDNTLLLVQTIYNFKISEENGNFIIKPKNHPPNP